MTFQALHHDVLDVLDEKVDIFSVSYEDALALGYELTLNAPTSLVRVPGGWRILLLNTLSQIHKEETAAHELGHLLLRGEGLASITLGDDWDLTLLADEMNSVISHHFLVDRLARDYQIDSELFLRLRSRIVEQKEEVLEEYGEEATVLYGLGLHLLDLSLTNPGVKGDIDKLLKESDRVRRAFLLGKEHLVYPNARISVEDQWQRVRQFMKELGLSSTDMRLGGL